MDNSEDAEKDPNHKYALSPPFVTVSTPESVSVDLRDFCRTADTACPRSSNGGPMVDVELAEVTNLQVFPRPVVGAMLLAVFQEG